MSLDRGNALNTETTVCPHMAQSKKRGLLLRSALALKGLSHCMWVAHIQICMPQMMFIFYSKAKLQH